MLKVVHDEAEPSEASCSVLDEIVREAATQMFAVALQAEVSAYIDAHAEEVDENGHRVVVRNGHHNEREVITAAGPVPVRAPRVNDKRTDPATGERKRFASAILPAWVRKSPRVAEVLPLLYLHGLSGSDFGPALTQFLGTSHGLSAATITRLTKDWQDAATTFNKRSLAATDYVYCWVDGIHLRTTNPIESTFATVRLRQRVTKGPGSRAAGVAMAFKLIESAQTRWRAVNAPHLVALVRAGAVFKNGKLIERPDGSEGGDQQVA